MSLTEAQLQFNHCARVKINHEESIYQVCGKWSNRYVVVKFLFQVIFVFLLFFGMVMYANEVETKEK